MIIHDINAWSEKFELADAEYYQLRMEAVKKSLDFLFEEVRETERAFVVFGLDDTPNFVEYVLDGFGDVAFIAINGIYKTFRALGQDVDSAKANTYTVLNRIVAANWEKLHNGEVVKVNGKVTKPKDWQEPTYGDLL